MSLVIMRKCPVLGCKFNKTPVASNISQLKKHVQYDHDYREKQETAFSLGLTDSIFDKRGVHWLVDSLSDFSRVNELWDFIFVKKVITKQNL